MRELDEVIADLKYGLRELKKSCPRYDEAEAYYLGDDPELYLSDSLRLYLRDSIAAFRLNVASTSVDVVADRMFIANITSPDAATQAEIDRIISENNFWAWSNDAIRESEMMGDEYIGVWDGADGRPVMSPLDPRTTRVIYDPELERIPQFLVRCWKETNRSGEEFERATISYSDAIYKFFRDSATTEWEAFIIEGEEWPRTNDLDDLPVGHLRNGFPYGRPGHSKSYGMQQVITKAVLNMVANIDFMGFRQRYAVKNPDQVSAGGLPSPSPRTRGGLPIGIELQKSPLVAGPGKLWNIIAESVGEFTPTDAKQFTDLITECIVNMARAERMPVRKFGIDSSGQQPSGESQREDDKSLRDRIASGRRTRVGGFVTAFSKALKIVNPDRKWGVIEIEWEKEDVVSDLSEYDVALKGIALIQQVHANPADTGVLAYAVQKFQEWGYSMQEIDSFLSNTSSPTKLINEGSSDLDSSEVE